MSRARSRAPAAPPARCSFCGSDMGPFNLAGEFAPDPRALLCGVAENCARRFLDGLRAAAANPDAAHAPEILDAALTLRAARRAETWPAGVDLTWRRLPWAPSTCEAVGPGGVVFAVERIRTDGSSWEVSVRIADSDSQADVWMAVDPQRSEADARATCERLASRLAILLADAARRGPGALHPPVATSAALAGARGDRRSGDDEPPS